MAAHAPPSPIAALPSRLERFGERVRLARWMEPAAVVFAIAVGLASWRAFSVRGEGDPLLTPPIVAGLVVANLIAGTILLVLVGRRLAMRRAAASPLGGRGRLHVQLVALFSLSASVPVVLVAIFASVLFQSATEFWFSDRARTMLENANALASSAYDSNVTDVEQETETMAGDLRLLLNETTYNTPTFSEQFALQLYRRELSEGGLYRINGDEVQTLSTINPYRRDLERAVALKTLRRVGESGRPMVTDDGERIATITQLPMSRDLYVYAAKVLPPDLLAQKERAVEVVRDYRALLERSRARQVQFNIVLILISLLIMAGVVWIALQLADRLIRPVGELVDATRRVTAGELSARVVETGSGNEIALLGQAFNRMTGRLEEQTRELVDANAALDDRNALMQAVLTGVTAGVISLDADRCVQLMNRIAREFFDSDPVAGHAALETLSPELDAFVTAISSSAILELPGRAGRRTIAANKVRDGDGWVLTFDDVTERLADQRRAAWADVARRIAHEIKNPLTPIQLAAERLNRRYGSKLPDDDTTFSQLTGTIKRQVGDLRRMIDEFSSFARMPKPVFREESLTELVRQAVFLQEIAHPAIRWSWADRDEVRMVCDGRQVGQALTNILKNAVEALERADEIETPEIVVSVTGADDRAVVSVADNGPGLPDGRDDLMEPYVTTHAKGTGLGLPIVKKIVEEHGGTMTLSRAPGGGALVTIVFDLAALGEKALEQPEMVA